MSYVVRAARWLLLSLLTCLAMGQETAAEQRPNVVVLLADDAGWGDVSLHGNRELATPQLDSLARDGARVERFYVCPVCSPTRAEFLTGRYHPRGGVWNVTSGGERLSLEETTIADTFRAAGYKTGMYGKWHNGSQYPYHPLGRGFQHFYGFTHGHWGHYFSPPLDHNGTTVQGAGFLADDLVDHALTFMEQSRGGPFFCYIAFNTPHSPMQVPAGFYEKFAARTDIDPHTRAAWAMMENLDWNVGRVLSRLDKLGLQNDTIVLYFSDNGPNGNRFNGPLKGKKGSTDEGGIRSPLFLRWPGKIAAGTVLSGPGGAIDLLPTLADLAGVPLLGGRELDGRSWQPWLLGSAAPWPERHLFSHWGGKVSVCNNRYRLDAQGALCDLIADPGQTKNVAKDHPEMVAEFRSAVAAWRETMQLDRLRHDARPHPVGHADFPHTELPARDGEPRGRVERSSRHPNCSFFQNWRGTAASVCWPVEVLTAGKYEVWLEYTCAKENVGCVAELIWQEARLQGKIVTPHDPPLVGADDDRSPRTESLMKAFRSERLGVWDMPAGRGELTLRMAELPSGIGPDIWSVRLRRIAGE